jgi:uncharacterized protein YceH (UPF0502 family)
MPLLNPTEVRVLGSLIEKQITTPEYYPLTLNSLTAACNQKNNRNPITSLTESEVEDALYTLREKNLATFFTAVPAACRSTSTSRRKCCTSRRRNWPRCAF